MKSAGAAVDAYYTPPALAAAVAFAMPEDLNGTVLDPTVGGGALLAAVNERFGGRVDMLGIDVDPAAVDRLRREQPLWRLSTADVLHGRSRGSAVAWRKAKKHLDAVVLNPPFSYRGNGGVQVTYGAFGGRVAPAVQFLTAVLSELRPVRCIVAVLPDGAIDAERHGGLWTEIARDYDVERLERFKSSSFRGARVATSLVKLTPRPNLPSRVERNPPDEAEPVEGCGCVEIVRGRVQVHTLGSRGSLDSDDPAPFLHTTGLAARHLPDAPGHLADLAPLVAIARVGRWSDPRIIDVGRVVLSDCVIGLRPRDRLQLDGLASSVLAMASDFKASFRGTGAQYVTIADVERLLQKGGWHPHRVKAGSLPADCCCSPHLERTCSNA